MKQSKEKNKYRRIFFLQFHRKNSTENRIYTVKWPKSSSKKIKKNSKNPEKDVKCDFLGLFELLKREQDFIL